MLRLRGDPRSGGKDTGPGGLRSAPVFESGDAGGPASGSKRISRPVDSPDVGSGSESARDVALGSPASEAGSGRQSDRGPLAEKRRRKMVLEVRYEFRRTRRSFFSLCLLLRFGGRDRGGATAGARGSRRRCRPFARSRLQSGGPRWQTDALGAIRSLDFEPLVVGRRTRSELVEHSFVSGRRRARHGREAIWRSLPSSRARSRLYREHDHAEGARRPGDRKSIGRRNGLYVLLQLVEVWNGSRSAPRRQRVV